MKKIPLVLSLCLVFCVVFYHTAHAAHKRIRIGFNLPLTGWLEQVGLHAKNAAEMVAKELAASGGLQVGDQTYDIEFIYSDNTSNPSVSSSLVVDLVSRKQVLALVGPLSSQQAIIAGEMANAFSTPMMAPWSTSPLTTLNRPFVFRSGYVLGIQGPVLTKFATKELKADKAAVLYDVVSAYPRATAKSFKEAFEEANGGGSVVAFEEFRTGDNDFRPQLRKIKATDADLLFTPQHYNEVPQIVHQAREIGLTIPILGANSWAGGDLTGACGDDCNVLFFVANYAAGGGQGLNKTFADGYQNVYGEIPDEPAALTWDGVRLLLQAIRDTGGLTGDLMQDRTAVRNAMVKIKDFDGATGKMTFDESGDPKKCAVMVRIDNRQFTSYDSICP